MFVIVTGGGRVGAQLTSLLIQGGHKVRLIENRPQVLERLHLEIPTEAIEQMRAMRAYLGELGGDPVEGLVQEVRVVLRRRDGNHLGVAEQPPRHRDPHERVVHHETHRTRAGGGDAGRLAAHGRAPPPAPGPAAGRA